MPSRFAPIYKLVDNQYIGKKILVNTDILALLICPKKVVILRNWLHRKSVSDFLVCVPKK